MKKIYNMRNNTKGRVAYFRFLLSAFSFLVSCEQVEDFSQETDANTVKVVASISNLQTRVAYSGDNGATNFVNGDAIKVVNLMRTSKNEATYTTTDGTNWTTTDAMVWNSSSKNIFQAWYPVAEYSSYDTFTIPTDQSDATKFASADWMTASTEEIDKPGNGVLDLNFQHRLAKVTVNLTFSSQYPEGNQLVSDFKFLTNEETPQVITALANSETSYTAILRPGEYADESSFIYLMMDNIDEHYVLGKTTTSAINLEAGKHYTFTLKVGKDVVSIDDVTVADWDEEDIDGGVAEEVMPNTFDATAMTPEQLNAAVTEALEYGHTEISVTLAADADATMFSAITAALAATVDPTLDPWEMEGTIDLTISGAKKVFDSAFGMLEGYNENWRAGAVLKTLTLPDVIEIEDYGINFCPNLTSVSAPKCEVLGEGALAENYALTSVYMPAARIIGNSTGENYGPFCMCDNLTEISLPEATILGNSAFAACWNLKTLYLPKVTEIIGCDAFKACDNLEEITLGALTTVNNANAGTFRSVTTGNVALVLSADQKAMNYDSSTKIYTAGTDAFDFNTTSFIGYTFKSISKQE